MSIIGFHAIIAIPEFWILLDFHRDLRRTIVFSLLLASNVFACYSDAECANDQICNDAGKCVADGRDWKTLKMDLLISDAVLKAKETGACYISAGSSKSCHNGLTFASCVKVASSVGGVSEWKKGESCK